MSRTFYTFFLLALAAVCVSAVSKRGVCLTMCDTETSTPCPGGYQCKTNGCGHQCYKTTFTQPEGCPEIKDDCGTSCLQGLKRDANGCEICQCYYKPYHPK